MNLEHKLLSSNRNRNDCNSTLRGTVTYLRPSRYLALQSRERAKQDQGSLKDAGSNVDNSDSEVDDDGTNPKWSQNHRHNTDGNICIDDMMGISDYLDDLKLMIVC